MTTDEFLARMRERFPQHRFEREPLNPEAIRVSADAVPAVFEWLRFDPATAMEYLEFCTCQDHPPERMSMVYYLYSYEKKHRLALKVDLERSNPALPTVCHLWQSADWNEREVYDLFGVFFLGHPDLRRLMMPEDWDGHPLRKDYLHPNLAVKVD